VTDDTTTDSTDDTVRSRTRTRSRSRVHPDAGAEDTAATTTRGPGSDGEDAQVIRRRRRRRADESGSEDSGGGERAGDRAEAKSTATDDGTAEAEPADRTRSTRSRRSRGRRGGRRGGSRSSGAAKTADGPDAADAPDEPTGEAKDKPKARTGNKGGRTDKVEETDKSGGDDKAPPTRLQARGRGRTGGRSSGRRNERTPARGVTEETRRAIAEGPPRKMLVTVGDKHTQIAVLEDRTLVEHFVTRKEDVSYVGNIYQGRVQNVLPGMEAAFVDIGKGRNGVLYAGEVNYDEADLEGDLPRIEQTLKAGQTVLVQVTKDPMGTKGARLTQHLSIAGRYCVLAPSDAMLGISRKLPEEERDRLRKILKSIKPEEFGLIVRTAAEGATREQLEADVARLVRIWEQVSQKAEKAKALDAVYEEPGLVIRVIRDVFGPEYTDLILDSEELAGQVREYLGDVSPELVDRVQVYPGDDKLFDGYEVTNQIRRALEKKVWLASGGYLIIEKTEAMWVIDVNTGKFVGKSNLEETVLKNNLEAADEIARQLRLRDMGGIIVIDFVDMLVPANRDEVLKRFKRELARDKTKSRVMEISKLGLVQMTRKNVSQGLTEIFTSTCETCEGRGATIAEHIV
jgi:Rne/Rng family ribonuclease